MSAAAGGRGLVEPGRELAAPAVGVHLGHVHTRLDIRSRCQLAGAAATGAAAGLASGGGA